MRIVAERDVMLEANIEAFEILADEDEIDILEAAARYDGAYRPNIGIKPEFLAQPHVDRAIAAADRRGQRAFQRKARAADAVERVLGQRIATLGERGHSGRFFFPG